MKSAVKRGAQRKLKLSMKRGSDAQIRSPFFDVRVEGVYQGWCSPEQRDELQELYDTTPSLLRPVVERSVRDPVQAAINELAGAIDELIEARVEDPKEWDTLEDRHSELALAIAGFADAVRNDTLDDIAARKPTERS